VAIGRNLREARLAAGLTQAQVADRSGLWRPNVGRLERGDGLPTLESVTRYCAAVGACRLAVLRPLDELQRWL
jgi:transcriptional regulator with XRE-family HTH domain